jgi:hypothetical protein
MEVTSSLHDMRSPWPGPGSTTQAAKSMTVMAKVRDMA